jgi:hypothetical protein
MVKHDKLTETQVTSGAALLDSVTFEILKYVVLPIHEVRAAALWVVHTHAFDLFSISPRLKVQSPEPGCGKTTLLDVLFHFVRSPMLTAHATAASVFREIAANRPTLLIDEADTSLDSRDLVTILNAGHRRNSASVLRANARYSVWAPVAFATIEGVPNQLGTRSIPINLRRKRPEETVKPFQFHRPKRLRKLQREIAGWVIANRTLLKQAKPELPQTLQNRSADNWAPLFAIADVAGGQWPGWARRAAEALSVSAISVQSDGVMLLSDVRDILAAQNIDRVFSNDLATALAAVEGRQWHNYNGHGAITANAVAILLGPYSIKPRDLRVGSTVRKGYLAKQFEDAFARYLPKQAA